MSKMAPVKGTVSIYSFLQDDMVLLMKENYNYFVTNMNVFEDLYIMLDDTRAALKEDCISYTEYYPGKPLASYPDWFIDAYDNGMIFEDGYGHFLFYDLEGDMAMSPGSLMLCNFLGELRYMERYDFEKYYDPIGGYDDEQED